MDYILDTCTALWFLNKPEIFSSKVTGIFTNSDNNFYVSVASIWEIAIKLSKGTLEYNGNAIDFCEELKKSEFKLLPILPKHTASVQYLPFHHKDPFDRLIISTALSENMTLITSDENIHKYEVKWVW